MGKHEVCIPSTILVNHFHILHPAYLYSASSVLTLSVPATQFILRLNGINVGAYNGILGHPSSFPWHHSENACLNKITPIVYACMSNETHFQFDNLGKEFAYLLKFIQYSCLLFSPSNLHQHSYIAPHFNCLYNFILSSIRIPLSFQIVSSSMVALLAPLILSLLSSEQLPVFVKMAPRYLKEFTLSVIYSATPIDTFVFLALSTISLYFRALKLSSVILQAMLARFSPPGRNRAAEILSARAAEIPFRPRFSPMGTNCSLFVMYAALFDD